MRKIIIIIFIIFIAGVLCAQEKWNTTKSLYLKQSGSLETLPNGVLRYHTWVDMENNQISIKYLMTDPSGEIAYGPSVLMTVYNDVNELSNFDTITSDLNLSLISSGSNCIVFWTEGAILKGQKISSSGQIEWNSPLSITLLDNPQYLNLTFSMISDNNGGAYVAWKNFYTDTEIYMRHITQNGVINEITNPELQNNGDSFCFYNSSSNQLSFCCRNENSIKRFGVNNGQLTNFQSFTGQFFNVLPNGYLCVFYNNTINVYDINGNEYNSFPVSTGNKTFDGFINVNSNNLYLKSFDTSGGEEYWVGNYYLSKYDLSGNCAFSSVNLYNDNADAYSSTETEINGFIEDSNSAYVFINRKYTFFNTLDYMFYIVKINNGVSESILFNNASYISAYLRNNNFVEIYNQNLNEPYSIEKKIFNLSNDEIMQPQNLFTFDDYYTYKSSNLYASGNNLTVIVNNMHFYSVNQFGEFCFARNTSFSDDFVRNYGQDMNNNLISYQEKNDTLYCLVFNPENGQLNEYAVPGIYPFQYSTDHQIYIKTDQNLLLFNDHNNKIYKINEGNNYSLDLTADYIYPDFFHCISDQNNHLALIYQNSVNRLVYYRFNENGVPLPFVGINGIHINNLNGSYLNNQAKTADYGFVCIYQGDEGYYAQVINTENGDKLLGESGQLLLDDSSHFFTMRKIQIQENYLYLVYNQGDILTMRKYVWANNQFNPISGNNGIVLEHIINPVITDIQFIENHLIVSTALQNNLLLKRFDLHGDLINEITVAQNQYVSRIYLNQTQSEKIFISWQNNSYYLNYHFQIFNSDLTANRDVVSHHENITDLKNYPNPFNPETKIQFQTGKDCQTELIVYNVKGQKVKTLVNEVLTKGTHNILWNGKDALDRPVSSGIYFYKIISGNEIKNGKMLLLK